MCDLWKNDTREIDREASAFTFDATEKDKALEGKVVNLAQVFNGGGTAGLRNSVRKHKEARELGGVVRKHKGSRLEMCEI